MAGILNTARDLERLRQIVGVLGRHGFGEIVQRTGLGSLLGAGAGADGEKVAFGARLRLAMQELGPSAVKLGQIISTRSDLVPAEVVAELKKLQDRVPPVPFDQLRESVEEALGAPLSDVYETFDETPLASASIGQVHRATLRTPEGPIDVVVKIQRPNIKPTIERDLDLLHWLARAVERSIPESRIYGPVRLVEEFERSIMAELDYHLEADNAARFTRNFQGIGTVHFPQVYREASSRRVLTLEFLDGAKVYDAVAGGHSGERIAHNTLHILIQQIFEDGFFHADPHPGNLLILGTPDAPVLGMIDLGLVGRLTTEMRDRTIDLMVAVAREDHKSIADALFAIGKPTRKIERRAFDAEVARLADRYLGKTLQDIEMSALIRDLVGGATKFGLEIPPDFLMVGKALMTVEGIGKEIHPELDVFGEVKPYFLKLFWQRYSPEKMSAELVRTASRIGGAASELPVQLQDVLEDIRLGRLVLRTEDAARDRAFDGLGRRVYSGFVVGALLLGGAVLVAQRSFVLGVAFLAAALLWVVAHGARMWLLRRRKRKAK
jgi:ubiquinone biosynthesis protein